MRSFSLSMLVVVVICATAVGHQEPQATAPAAVQTETGVKAAPAATGESVVIPRGAKVFVAPMPDKFDEFLKTAIVNKHVPVTVVDKKEDADFEITGFSETQKAGAAKIILMGSWHSRESASIKVSNLKSGVVAYAYSYNTDNSRRGKKSSSESCAKHLKEKIESGK